MTIYTDGTHVVSDRGLHELQAWARQADVKHSKYRPHPRHPHYLLPKFMQGQAMVNAMAISSRDLVRVLRGQSFGKAELVAETGEARRTPKHLVACGFCGEPFTNERPNAGYIYPVAPVEGDEYDGTDGRQACSECYPTQTKRSVDAGLLILYSAPAAPAKEHGAKEAQ